MGTLNSQPEFVNSPSTPTISTLRGMNFVAEISALRSKQRSLDGRRRDALNKILDIRGSTRVFCRVCCSSDPCDRKNPQSPISIEGEKIVVRSVGGKRKEFDVDKAFPKEATHEDVFEEVDPVLRSALDGHNVCIFAYGQTGTGKTYTMEGRSDQPGIVPRSIEELFRQVSQEKSSSFTLSISMLEIYVGSIRDLLAKKKCSSLSSHKGGLNILSSNNGSVEIEGLTDVVVSDFKQAYRYYAKGKRTRVTSWTNVNDASSRSHCLTRITIRRSEGKETTSKLWMVDLGGSERLLKTGAIGQTLDEGKAINLSLSALGDVVVSLKKKLNHIPYRNSKLTQILSDSLGDGSKVLMIVHVSPHESDVGETTCSLSFARRVRAIENIKEISEELKNRKEKCISELGQQIKDAEAELQKVRNQIEKYEELIHENNQLLEEHRGSPRSPLIVLHGEELTETPQTDERHSRNPRILSVPRFMSSTESSRRRQSANEQVNGRIARTLHLSYPEPSVKPHTKRLKSKIAACEARSLICKSIDSKSSFKKFSSVSHHHRRRMSDLT